MRLIRRGVNSMERKAMAEHGFVVDTVSGKWPETEVEWNEMCPPKLGFGETRCKCGAVFRKWDDAVVHMRSHGVSVE